MSTSNDSESVLGDLESFVWDSEEAVAYEAAIEAINAAVGAYSARIAAEEGQPTPDAALIDELLAAQTSCARAQEQLDPSDHAQIAEARRHFSALGRTISGR